MPLEWIHPYVPIWRKALCAFLGWSVTRADYWMLCDADDLSKPEDKSLLTHENPFFWLSSLLMTRKMRERARLETGWRAEFDTRLVRTLNDDSHPRSNAFDWDAATDRLAKLLNECGDDLETLRAERRVIDPIAEPGTSCRVNPDTPAEIRKLIWQFYDERATTERRRLLTGVVAEYPGIMLQTFLVQSSTGRISNIIAVAKRALLLANETQDVQTYRERADAAFCNRFRKQMPKEELDRWLAEWKKLPWKEQAKREQELGWSLDDWLIWFDPEEARQWFYWGETLIDDQIAHVTVEILGRPYPSGALRQLFIAAGADRFDELDSERR